MAKGSTKSKLSLKERRERAFDLIGRGYKDVDIAADIGVSRQTAASYRRTYEDDLVRRAAEQPDVVGNAVANIFRLLAELDDVRTMAHKKLARRKKKVSITCDSCLHEMEFTYQEPPNDQATVQYQNVLLKAADQRAKVLGLMGVKQEVFVEIQNVNIVQQRLIGWLQTYLPQEWRVKLADFMESELSEYIATDEREIRPVLPASVLESRVVEN